MPIYLQPPVMDVNMFPTNLRLYVALAHGTVGLHYIATDSFTALCTRDWRPMTVGIA